MTARDDAGFDSFSDPGAHDKVSNFSLDAHKIARAHAELRSVTRMQPERICVRYFIQPFRIRATRVNLNRQAKRRAQNRLIGSEIFRMNVTDDLSRTFEFVSAPIG